MSDTPPRVHTHLLAAHHLLRVLDDVLVSASNDQTGLDPDDLQALVTEIRERLNSANAVLENEQVWDLPAPRLATPWDEPAEPAESEAVQHG